MKIRALVFAAMILSLMAGTAFAHEGKHQPTAKSALHELKEAKQVISKLTPDADGHIAKASQLIDQAADELKAVAPAAKA